MSLKEVPSLTGEELSELVSSGRNFVLYVRSERDKEKIREIFDLDVVFPELAKSFSDSVPFYVIELQEGGDILRSLGVSFAPSVLFFKEGKLLKKYDGIRSWAEYTESVGELLC